MSQKPNPRRGEKRHQDNGPTWEGGPPGSGCNSTHVARSRKKWKRYAARSERRVGTAVKFMSMGSGGRHPKPRPEE